MDFDDSSPRMTDAEIASKILKIIDPNDVIRRATKPNPVYFKEEHKAALSTAELLFEVLSSKAKAFLVPVTGKENIEAAEREKAVSATDGNYYQFDLQKLTQTAIGVQPSGARRF